MDPHKIIEGRKTSQARVGAVRHEGEPQAQGKRGANQDNRGIRYARPDADYPEYDSERHYGAGQADKKK